jgi:hypothetical protein
MERMNDPYAEAVRAALRQAFSFGRVYREQLEGKYCNDAKKAAQTTRGTT